MRARPLLAVLLLTCVTLTALDAHAGSGSPLDPVRSAADALLAPVDRVVGTGADAVGGVVGSVGDLADRSELQRLRDDNARLRRDAEASAGSARESGQWRALLGLRDTARLTIVPARVVAAGRSLGFERTVRLDVGSRDGVRSGQTVVAAAGLVGRTLRVTSSTCTVLVLDDRGFGVGARLATTGALGLASGDGSGRLRWVQVDPGPVAVGATLLTTGSDTFVPDLPVGTVRGVDGTPGGPTATATVRPFVDVGSLDLVGVVVDVPRTTPRASLPPS